MSEVELDHYIRLVLNLRKLVSNQRRLEVL